MNRVTEIDGWRAISVSLVILSHLLIHSSIALDRSRFMFFDAWGHLGVQIFFVISGFVICRGLLAEEARTGRVSIVAFYVRRVFRILPPLLLFLLVIIGLWKAGLVALDISYLPHILTFTCNLSVSCGGQVVDHLWSLSIEEQFYLVFPFLFVLVAGSRKAVLGVWGILFPAIVLGLAVARIEQGGYLADFLYINIGIVCALYEAEIAKLCRRLPGITPLLCFAALLLVTALLGPNKISTLARYLVLPPLIALMLMTSHYRQSVVSAFLNLPVLVSVGQVSYGLYLWQQLATYRFEGAGIAFYALSLTACMAVVYASFHLLEAPLIKAGKVFSQK